MACFLLPHPGKVVTTKQEFQGALKDIDEDFIKHLKVCSLFFSNRYRYCTA
jgi:hypothetical protein